MTRTLGIGWLGIGWALAAAMLLGCGADRAPLVHVRDSAGTRIVDNFRPSGLRFELDSVPVIDIGPEGGPGAEFVSSPVSALRLPDKRIIAAGWAMTQVKVFDSAGRWLRDVGRAGAGPGEFVGLGFVFPLSADSVLTFEPMSQRVQRWTPAMSFDRLAILTSPPDRPTAWVRGTFDDGSLLLATSLPDEATSTSLTTGMVTTLSRAASSSAPWDSLTAFPSAPRLRRPSQPTTTYGGPLFVPEPSYHARGSRLAFASGARFEIEIRTKTGALQMIIRRPSTVQEVSDADFDRAVAAWRARFPAALQAELEPALLKASPRTRPPVAEVWLAGDGRIWAVYGDPTIGEAARASVFDHEGLWEGDIELPTGLQINQIDADGLLGTFEDADGFRHLRFYQFVSTRDAAGHE